MEAGKAVVIVADEWWQDGFGKALDSISKKKKKKSKKHEKETKKSNPTFEDLFAATGGARLGMRARADQKGKLLRTETEYKDHDVTVTLTKAAKKKDTTQATDSVDNILSTQPHVEDNSHAGDEELDIRQKSNKKEKKRKREIHID